MARTAHATLAGPMLSAEHARIVRTFLDNVEPGRYDVSPVMSLLADVCPHPSASYGGSMGDVCDVCGAMRPSDPPCEHITAELESEPEHEHDEHEDCMTCTCCGRCREDLDADGLCIPCGGIEDDPR